jgi:hypothetical protein
MGNKQTAVEWLLENLKESLSIEQATAVINKAKEMEKEQITDSYIMGSYDMADKEFRPEQYYNETYE